MLLIYGSGGIAHALAASRDGDTQILPKSVCDVTDRAQVVQAFHKYQPTAVVVCAGVSSPDDHEQEVAVNLIGTLNVAMAARGTQTILIASVAGLYGKPHHVGYSASKAGVISVAQSLACEGYPVWCISPGRVDTPMREKDYPGDTPGSRLDPKQIASAVTDILEHDLYPPGTNIVIRKEGLDTVIVHAHTGDGWKERLRVGQPVTI